jgi:predicted ATPase/class 3 adenylate cyclase
MDDMCALPTGTVTFLFTDIEGSTKLLQELEDAYAETLAQHRAVLTTTIEKYGGDVVDTQGDAFFVAFRSASDAVRAAAEAQRQLEVPVRMGIHIGEPQLVDGRYVGLDVHRAARICSAAHGRQIVLSERTARQLEGAPLKDLGLHRLKDLGEPVKLFQVGDEDFPPLRSLNATNLPAQPPLVGRAAELAELAGLVRAERLVTLTGPGGSGKTRLALQVAAESVDAFADGVFWVPLAAITDPAIVESSIGETIGARDALAEYVDGKRMLLLLDNLEQLLPDAAPLLAAVVERCANLRLLVTSRAPLRIIVEREYAVEPLPEADAVSLFRERAFAVEPEDAVHEICRRLDGLPLAVELAAARTRVLRPDRLLARLDQALPILTGGRRDAPERQRTLRATIAWSYDLLDVEEQTLFRHLAVFAGSFEPEAAEEICGADLGALEALVEHSLVRRWASGRLGMLETIREFAIEKLEQSGEADPIRRRHAEFFMRLARSAGLRLDSLGTTPQRHELVLPEQHNLRASMEWAADHDPKLGLQIAVSLENFWVTHDPREGVRWFETFLERAEGVELPLRARALLDLSGSADWSGEEKKARAAIEEALELFRQAGDENGVAEARFRLGVVAARRGEFELARELWQESLDEWRRLGDEAGIIQALGNLGWWEFEHGDDWAHAWELTEQSLEMARRIGWTWWEVGRLGELAERCLDVGKLDEGERRAREYLRRARAIEDRTNTLFGLAMLAWAAGDRGDAERSTTLWAAIEAEQAKLPEPLLATTLEKYIAHIPDEPRPSGLLDLDEAVESALADS